MTQDHYATLGVARDASPSEVKKAYRRRAKKAHPDQGGSNTEMVAVNEAWQVLGDDERRQHYDRTGNDELPSMRDRAHRTLGEFFAAALGKDAANLLVAVHQMLDMQRDEAKAQISMNGHKVAKLMARRGKVRTKTMPNALHQLIDAAVKALNEQIVEAEDLLAVNAVAREMAADYESDEEDLIVPRGPVFRSTFSPGGFR